MPADVDLVLNEHEVAICEAALASLTNKILPPSKKDDEDEDDDDIDDKQS